MGTERILFEDFILKYPAAMETFYFSNHRFDCPAFNFGRALAAWLASLTPVLPLLALASAERK
jgi:hypothetical protein